MKYVALLNFKNDHLLPDKSTALGTTDIRGTIVGKKRKSEILLFITKRNGQKINTQRVVSQSFGLPNPTHASQ